MNFDLAHMKAHKEQKDRILAFNSAARTMQPTGQRVKGYIRESFKSLVFDIQSLLLFIVLIVSFIFWIVCLLLNDKEE